MRTVTLYRDDSTTQCIYENVKHLFWTAGNTVLVIAQYSDVESGAHHYIQWPRERFCWFKDQPEVSEAEDALMQPKEHAPSWAKIIEDEIQSLREQLEDVRASRIKTQNEATRFAESLVSVMEATGVFTQTDETSDEDVLNAANAYVTIRKAAKDLKAPATKDNG